jgi:LysR family hydrogen peroxide-inducible transcriptional activator
MKALPTLRQLQFFVALVRQQSFSKAAEDSLVSQSTLSAAIKELEHTLDAELVDRSSKGFALTPIGEDMVQRAQDLLNAAEDMARVAGPSAPLAGVHRLGLLPTIGPFILPAAMPLFQETHTDLSLYLREGLTATLLEDLRAGRIDMALIAFPYETEGLESHVFAEDKFVFVCPQNHPRAKRKLMTVDELVDEELLLLEEGHCLRDQALSACQLQASDAANTFGGTSLFTLSHMVRSGLGVTLLPEMAVKAGLAKDVSLVTIPFKDTKAYPAPARQIGLVWRKGAKRDADAAAMGEVFRQALESQAV